MPQVPTLLHSWSPGSSHLDDAAFPIVRRTKKLLGLSQMEAEIRAICYQDATCSTGELDIVTAGATSSPVNSSPGRRTAVKMEGQTGVVATTRNHSEEDKS